MDIQDLESLYPLSPAQKGILFQSLYAQGDIYLVQIAVTLEGPMDAPALERAWQDVVRRHSVLRTSFHWEDLAKPIQVVRRELPFTLEVHDQRGKPEAEQAAWEAALLADERRTGFDLGRGPCFRVRLVRLAEARQQLILSYHHILLDAWSAQILLGEVFALYEGETSGHPVTLEPVLPYREFIAWVEGRSGADARRFWTERLKGYRATTLLPWDRAPRSLPEATDRFDEVSVVTAEAGLLAFCARQKLTLGTLLHTAWALVLARHAEEDDVVFGSTVSGRSIPLDGVDRMVGLFLNTLPVRIAFAAATSTVELLRSVQGTLVAAREFEQSQLGEIRAASELAGDAPLFESILVFQNVAREEVATEAGDVRRTGSHQQENSGYPLTLVIDRYGDGLTLLLAYNTRRFARPDVERLLGQLRTVLASIVAHPEWRAGAHRLLDDEERRRVLTAWNPAPAAPSDEPLHVAFEAQVDLTPDRTALVAGDLALTYRALDERANRLAHHLRAQHVGPEDRVALVLPASVDALVGMLAVLKAGAAYLPLDPDAPAERLAFVLRDAGVRLALTRRPWAAKLDGAGARVLVLEDAEAAVASQPGARPTGPVHPERAAYVVYTSGSTGEPKGVIVSHRAVINHGRSVARRFELGADDRMLQFTPLHFDAAVEEIFPVLLGGATVVLHGDLIPVDEFAGLIERQGLTVISMPPAYVHAWLSHLERVGGRVPGCLRRVILGGEAILPQTRELWLRLGGEGIPWFNVYGPTEGTVTSSMERLDGRLAEPLIPMGRPIDNVQIYLVDADLEPVGVRMPGEICLAGLGLARGYLGRAELTADKFIPNPFSSRPGARMYRTGDRAQFLPDGRLVFLGRVDRQVKIRGARVELGEVEAALGRHVAVQEAVVVAREDGADRRLVAYVVPKQPGTLTVETLRAHVELSLPEYMAPSAYVLLEALPLTANGKVDFRALPAPTWGADARAAHVAPEGDVEEKLAAIFAEVLRVERVSAHARFFEIGGHSLLALQAIARIRKELAVDLPLKALFEDPTVARLAVRVAAASADGGTRSLPIERQPRDGRVFPASFGQEQMWLLHQLEPQGLGYSIPLKLRVRGPLDVVALERALVALVRRHEVLRTTYATQDDRSVQRIHPEMTILEPTVDLRAATPEAQDAEIQRLGGLDASRPFDLARGPMVRAQLVRQREDLNVLLLSFHHVVFDGWSMLVLLEDLSALYEAERTHAPAALPELEVQFAEYAVWQRAVLTPERLELDLAWWRSYLEGAPELLALPTDRPRPPVPSRRNARVHFELPETLATALRALARREEATLFSVMMSVFGQLLHRYTGEDGLMVGTITSTRDRPELEALIGYFVNQIPLRMRELGTGTVRETIRRTHENFTSLLDRRHVPFRHLVEIVQPERSASYAPLVQVAMQLDSTPPPEDEVFKELTFEEFDSDPGENVYDLLLHVDDPGSGPMAALCGYNTDLFDVPTIERLARHLVVLAEAFVRTPDAPVAWISMLTPAERERTVQAWNPPPTALPVGTCVHELFEAQARATPDATALIDASEAGGVTTTRTSTYRELDRRANGLAHRLRALGVGPESTVGLLCDRSLDALTAIYAVLKAGGAYVPMDVGAPVDRLRFMVQNLGTRVVLADAGRAAALAGTDAQVLDLARELEALGGPGEAAPPVRTGPSRAAYVIFTSGTTGEPKGVLVPHHAVVNHNLAIAAALELGPTDRILQFTPLNFDAAGEEIFPPLARGATVVIAPDHLGYAEFGELVSRQEVTVASLPPAFVDEWLLWVEQEGRRVPTCLRLVILGGEKIPPEAYARWRRLGGASIPWVNVYGPTEATVTAGMGALVPEDLEGKALPIGRPIANAQLYVLDGWMRLLPQGLPGELYIGGAGLARGYAARAAETAERFVPDPNATLVGARLYRTGDLARHLPDGRLEVLGRADHQVKIRGHRIELGEVESVLRALPEIASAIAIARDDLPTGRGLVAYVVGQPWAELDVWALRTQLEARLPPYMIPSLIGVLAALPLTRGGKIDLKALPVPEMPARSREASAPEGELELQLAALWEAALQLSPVSMTDNFFELGGHSLLMVQLVTKVRELLGVTLTMVPIFEDPTLKGLVNAVRAALARGRDDAAPPSSGMLVPLAVPDVATPGRPLFLVHTLGGDVTCFAPLASRLGRTRPVYGLKAEPLATEGPRRFEELAARYVAAIRSAQPTGPYAIAGHSFGSYLAYEAARQLSEAGETISMLALLDTLSPTFLRQRFPDEVGQRDESRLDLPEAYSPEEARAYARLVWSHMDLADAWVPGSFAGPLLSLGCATSRELEPVSLGWGAHAPDTRVLAIPGDHLSLLEPPNVDDVARAIAEHLAGH